MVRPSRFMIKLKQCCPLQILSARRKTAFLTKAIIIIIVTICVTLLLVKSNSRFNHERDLLKLLPIQIPFQQAFEHQRQDFFSIKRNLVDGEKQDWHDYKFIENEETREGRGEKGEGSVLTSEEEKEYENIFKQNGYNGVLSDKISVNRSIKDIRHKDCLKQTYLKDLPTVSVIVPFYNEHLSALLRTAHSVYNRSPSKLLKEIILVNDHSTKEFLYDELKDYVAHHFYGKVKIVDLPERSGLIWARMAGARKASGDVLIFLDSHTEPNINWLPPLLEPIAENYKVCVCPFIDVIDWKTFEYRAQDEGKRGAFDWKFYYKRLPLRPEDKLDPIKPFPSPVMAGGLFAISSKFFWELEGYDEGLDIWGGEQYELSFKIWQCGGAMYDAPCSRVGHIYRGLAPFPNPRGKDFISRNFKRVAEVWMDEYANFMYEHRGNSFENIDTGDLTKQKALRQKLSCKPFKWFLEEVAPDLLEKYPPIDPPEFASGVIQSMAASTYCVDTLNHDERQAIGMYPCANNKTHPQSNQYWSLSYFRDIRLKLGNKCMDVSTHEAKAPLKLFNCHESQGNQLFKYNLAKKMIYFSRSENRCLDCNPTSHELYVSKCDDSSPTQKWTWGYINATALNDWIKSGSKLM